MEKLRKVASWLWSNLGNLALVGGWFVSAGILPALLALGEGATPVGYGIAGGSGILAYFVVLAIYWRTRLWRIDARNRERMLSNSSPFDPMARVYQDKRLFLKDLVPAGRRELRNKKFINCEIIGPGNIVVALRSAENLPFPHFANNIYHDVDCLHIRSDVVSYTAIYLLDCDFDGCNFYHLNLLFYERLPTDWHWMTTTMPLLLEDKTDEPS